MIYGGLFILRYLKASDFKKIAWHPSNDNHLCHQKKVLGLADTGKPELYNDQS